MKMALCLTAALTLLYWLFAGEFSATEVVAMVISLVAAVALALASRRVASRRLEFQAPWVRLFTSTLTSICKDSVKVGCSFALSLVHRTPCPAGSITRQPFEVGDSSPSEAGRRALVTLSVSASPDRYVIDLTPKEGLLSHSLVGGASNSDPRWPV